MKSLKEIVKSLRDCNYICEAGPLENNADFHLLEQIAGVERTLSVPVTTTLEERLWTPQKARDEIIEQAKRDVAELSTTWRPGCPSLNYPPSAFDPSSETVNFEINSEKRTVVCYITNWSHVHERTMTSFRGIAKCNPSDCFNVHIGKAIALRRALGLEVPAEYLRAPQPTEVRVGDVVKSTVNQTITWRVTTVRENGRVDVITDTGNKYREVEPTILYTIDDSRADAEQEVAE